jgi:hypothetical protein
VGRRELPLTGVEPFLFRLLMMSRSPVTLSIGIDNPEIMLRMLGVIFRRNAIPGRLGIAGQRQIFLKQLMGTGTKPHLRPIAAKGSAF